MANNENQAARVFVVAPMANDLVKIDRDGMTGQLWSTIASIAALGGGGGGGGGVAFDTGNVANGQTVNIGLASPGHIYMIVAMDKNNTAVVGMWIVFGTAYLNAFLNAGCALNIVGNQLVLTNQSGGPIDFIGTIFTWL